MQEKLTRNAGRKKKKSDMTVGEVKILQSRGMNRAAIARELGINRSTLQRRIKKAEANTLPDDAFI